MADAPRRYSWLMGAILTASLVPGLRAAEISAEKADSASNRIDELQSDIGRPDDFQRFVEGSRLRRDGSPEPRAYQTPSGRGPAARGLRGGPRPSPRLESAAVPAPAAAGRTSLVGRFDAPKTDLPLRGMSAVLGLGLMLIAGSLVLDLVSPPAPEPAEETPLLRAPAPTTVEFAPALARAEASSAPAPYVDHRMPAGTWRAISWREQQVIERWDASREKALGLASLTEWLERQPNVAGVDVALLRAKLYRDA